MSFMEKFKNIIGIDEEEYEDDIEVDEFVSHKASPAEAMKEEDAPKSSNKVVNIHTTAQVQVVLVKPEQFSDAPNIADNLKAKRTVVLNLESTNRDIARRLLDFLSGCAYADEGSIKRVANSTYIITPYNVDVLGDDILDELEHNGMFM